MSLASDDVCSLEEGLAGDLEGVTRWVKANKLKLNVKKTQLLLLGRRKGVQRMEQAEIWMDGQVIQRSKEVKCLGVLLDDELKWKEQVLRVRKKGFAGLSRLRRLRDMLPPSTKKKLYNALVLPHLDYCSVVWQECSEGLRQKLERVQNYGMRLILSKPPRTPSAGLREELQWLSLEKRREVSRLALVHRCVKGQAPSCLAARLKTNAGLGRRMTRGHSKLFVPQATTGYFHKSFTFVGIKTWNRLPNEVRSLNCSKTFKKRLRSLWP